MSVKSLLLDVGVMVFVVLTIPKPVFGLSEIPARARLIRGIFVMVALAFVLVGA